MKRVLLIGMCSLFLISCMNDNEMFIGKAQAPDIVGAWERLETEKSSADTIIVTRPYKGIFLFTDSHYSIAVAPRERASLPENRSSQDIASAEAGYISNSGTYKIVGDSIYFKVLVSKFPNFMNNQTQSAWAIEMENNQLILTSRNENMFTKTIFRRLE